MVRETTVGGAAVILAIVALLLGPGRAAAADDAPAAGDRIVPPSAAPSPPAKPWQGGVEIATDLFIGRSTALMATVAGSALFVISLPITAPSGTYDEALERFVVEPGNRLIGPLGK